MVQPDRDEELTTAERQVLDAWEVPAAPADLTARALARVRRRRRRRMAVGLAAGVAAVALAGGYFYGSRGTELRGSRVLTARTTVPVGDRAVAVAEPGTKLDWRVAADGSARVEQRSGNVFYRVEPGGPFRVSTPHGTVKVLGTCFRVEVEPMRASRAGVLGATAGAALASVVIVSVYEGKVMSAPAEGADGIEVPAGKVASMDGRSKPRIVGDVTGEGADEGARRAGGPARRADLVAKAGPEQTRALAARARELESELETLRAQLEESSGAAAKSKMLDLTQEERAALARRCELRWDVPFHGSEPPTISSKDREKVGLTAEEAQLVDEVMAAGHEQLLREMRKIYAEVTGDARAAEQMSPSSLVEEIKDKSPRPELKAVYRRLARERAGLQAPPPQGAERSPAERLMRLLTTAGDRMERAIGEKVGPDLARRHRELHGGYGSKSRSSYGCPE